MKLTLATILAARASDPGRRKGFLMYVYLHSEPNLFTVGFYDPTGKWQPESDHATAELAAVRVAFLNGGSVTPSQYQPAKDQTPQPAAPRPAQPSHAHLPRRGTGSL